MKVTANIATYPPRSESVIKVVLSLGNQVDVIRICFNEYDEIPEWVHNIDVKAQIIAVIPKENLTDNGKYIFLEDPRIEDEPEIYATCDDDIIYPEDFREKLERDIETFGCIVTYHGRILLGKGRNYYTGHRAFRFLSKHVGNQKIDVCGTGVTAWRTDYFHPLGLAEHKLKRMCDLTFSLAAAQNRKMIGIMEHSAGWFKQLDHPETIFDTERARGCDDQQKLADLIYELNHAPTKLK